MNTVIQPGTQPQSTKKAKDWSFGHPSTWPITKKLFPAQAPLNGEGASIQIFESVGRIDKLLLFIFEAVSSLSVLLLAFGLITSQTNVQTHGEILTANPGLQEIWAWTQNIAIDMSLLGAIIRACVYWLEKERMKALLYTLLSGLLLFTAAIVSNIEAVMQSISGLSLQGAYGQVIFPVTVQQLTAIRSLAIVLILVAHAVQYVGWYQARYRAKKQSGQQSAPVATAPTTPQSDMTTLLESLALMNQQTLQAVQQMSLQNQNALQVMTQQTLQATAQEVSRITVSMVSETLQQLSMQVPVTVQEIGTPVTTEELEDMASPDTSSQGIHSSLAEKGYKEEIEELLTQEPHLSDRELAQRVGCSVRTANRWKTRLQQAVIA